MKKVINKCFENYPVYYISFETDKDILKMKFINTGIVEIYEMCIEYLGKEYFFKDKEELSKKQFFLNIENIDPNLVGTPVLKYVRSAKETYMFSDYKNDATIIKPRPVHFLGKEKYLYISKFSKANKYPKKDIKFIPVDSDVCWSCVCGHVNYNEDMCENCKIEKKKVFSVEDKYEREMYYTSGKINMYITSLIYMLILFLLSLFGQGLLGDMFFENNLKNEFFGLLNRFIVPTSIILSVVVSVYSASKYMTKLEKITLILRCMLLLYLNLVCAIYSVGSAYNFAVVIGFDIVFLISLIYYFKKYGRINAMNLVTNCICLICMITFGIKTLYYNQYDLIINKAGIQINVEVEDDCDEYVSPAEIDGIKVVDLYFNIEKKYNFETIVISENIRDLLMYSNIVLPNVENIIINEGNKELYLEGGILHNNKGEVVYVPSNVSTIFVDEEIVKRGSYMDALSVEEVIISKNVTYIEQEAFSGCINLKSITFEEGSLLKVIEDLAFSNTGVVSLELPKSLENAGMGILKDCNNLESLKTPFIGSQRESDPTNLLAQDVLARFFWGGYMQYDYVPKSLKNVEVYDIVLIHNVTFYRISSLTNVVLSDEVYEIGKRSFSGCSSLLEFVIPSKVTIIDEGCFENCSSLEKIYIPKGVTKIEKGAFKNCLSLKEVIYEGNLNNLIIEEDNNYLKAILFEKN